jgi:hypothetical protein
MHRPVEGNKRVPPRKLKKYRESHQFLGPCCLCPLLAQVGEEQVYTEAIVDITVSGRFKGEYVAECAKSQCGYIGEPPYSLK